MHPLTEVPYAVHRSRSVRCRQVHPCRQAGLGQDCQRRTREALLAGKTVAVANTFTQRWEMQPYLDMVKEIGCPFAVIDLFDGGMTDDQLADRNVHGVPMVAIHGMRARYEHDWTKGDPRAPWER